MARFFFHLCNHDRVRDEEGLELPDLKAAREEAIRGVRSILADEVKQGCLPLDERVEVENEIGDRVLTLPFRDAVKIES